MATTLHCLGEVKRALGDLNVAQQQLEKALAMYYEARAQKAKRKRLKSEIPRQEAMAPRGLPEMPPWRENSNF